MYNPFTKHPHSIEETYFTHMIEALKYCFKFFTLFIITLIHAFFPFTFTSTSSKVVKKINTHLENRLSKAKKD
jgi:hypothetical protein